MLFGLVGAKAASEKQLTFAQWYFMVVSSNSARKQACRAHVATFTETTGLGLTLQNDEVTFFGLFVSLTLTKCANLKHHKTRRFIFRLEAAV